MGPRHGGLRDLLIGKLQSQGYLVLVATDARQALHTIKLHSRPIQLMLTDDSAEGRRLADEAKPYRRKMNVLFLSGDTAGEKGNLYSPEQTLARLEDAVPPPHSLVADGGY